MLDFDTLYKVNQVRAIELQEEIEHGLNNDLDVTEQEFELKVIEEWFNPE